MRSLVLTVALCLAASSGRLAGQTPQNPPPPTFRSSVTLVTVDVVVLDTNGKPVVGLTPQDFKIKLNGHVQPVRALSYVQTAETAAPLVPSDVAPTEPVGRHVATNTAPIGDARLFVLMVDDLSFVPGAGKSLFASAARFVARQPAADYIGMTTTSGSVIVNPTPDRAAIGAALRHVVGEFTDPRRPMTPSSPTVSIQEAIDIVDFNDSGVLRNVITRECFGGIDSASASVRTDELVARTPCAGAAQSTARMIAGATHATTGRQTDAIVQAIKAMKPARGLKQLVLMSQGIGVTRNAITDLEPIARAAAESGVQLSVLVQEGDDLDMGDPGHSQEDPSGNSIGPPEAGLTGRRRDDQRMFRSAMQTLAETSGGYFQSVIGSADTSFDRAAVAGSALYRLGVEPPSDAPEGKPMSVSTSVERSGVTVQSNRQAVMPGPAPVVTPDDQMTAAIKEGQPFFNVPIRLGVARRRASAGQVELVIGMDVPASVAGPLTMAFGLVSATGELRTGKKPIDAPAARSNYRFSFPLPVAPGLYQLRFAVTDATGSVGSINIPVDAHLPTIGSLNASDVLTWWKDADGKSQFLALDEVPANVSALGAGIELYPKPGVAFPANVTVKMSLIPAGTTTAVVEREVAPLSDGDLLRVETLLPLADVPVGAYTLRATVSIDGAVVGTAASIIKKR